MEQRMDMLNARTDGIDNLHERVHGLVMRLGHVDASLDNLSGVVGGMSKDKHAGTVEEVDELKKRVDFVAGTVETQFNTLLEDFKKNFEFSQESTEKLNAEVSLLQTALASVRSSNNDNNTKINGILHLLDTNETKITRMNNRIRQLHQSSSPTPNKLAFTTPPSSSSSHSRIPIPIRTSIPPRTFTDVYGDGVELTSAATVIPAFCAEDDVEVEVEVDGEVGREEVKGRGMGQGMDLRITKGGRGGGIGPGAGAGAGVDMGFGVDVSVSLVKDLVRQQIAEHEASKHSAAARGSTPGKDGKNEYLVRRVSEVEVKVKKTLADIEKRYTMMDTELQTLSKQVSGAVKTGDGVDKRLQAIEEVGLTELSKKITEMDDFGQLRSGVDMLMSELDGMRKKIAVHDGMIPELATVTLESKQMTEKIATMQKSLSNISKLEQDVSETKKSIDDIDNNSKTTMSRMDVTHTEMQTVRDRVKEVFTHVCDASDGVDELKKTIAELQIAVDEARRLSSSNADIINIQQQQSSTKSASSTSTSTSTSQTDLAHLQHKLSALQHDTAAFRADLDAMGTTKAEMEQLSSNIGFLVDNVAAVGDKYETLQRQVDELREGGVGVSGSGGRGGKKSKTSTSTNNTTTSSSISSSSSEDVDRRVSAIEADLASVQTSMTAQAGLQARFRYEGSRGLPRQGGADSCAVCAAAGG
jgi:chromosome segregation ATPase